MLTWLPNTFFIAAISAALQSTMIDLTFREKVLLSHISHSSMVGMISWSVMKKQTGTPLLVAGERTTTEKKIGIFDGRDKGLAGFMSRINAPLSGFF